MDSGTCWIANSQDKHSIKEAFVLAPIKKFVTLVLPNFHKYVLTPCLPSNIEALHISQLWNNLNILVIRKWSTSLILGRIVWIMQTTTVLAITTSQNLPMLRNVTRNLTSNQILYDTINTIFHLNNVKEAIACC